MKQHLGLILLSVAILLAAFVVAVSHRYQHVAGELNDAAFDRWTGKYHKRQ